MGSTERFLSRAKSLISSLGKLQVVFLLGGVLLVLFGLILKGRPVVGSSNVEVLQNPTSTPSIMVTVDVSGEVMKPGVYKLPSGSRVDDALSISGGLTENADKIWVEKSLNRAAKLTDGQKIFIPSVQQFNVMSASISNQDSSVVQYNLGSDSKLININTASLETLDGLPGIGPVYGQKIIDNRPYSEVSELITKKILKQSTYDKVKDLIKVY